MNKKLLLLLTLLNLLAPIRAQQTGSQHTPPCKNSTVQGFVWEKEGDTPIAFATVYLRGTSYGCATAEDGSYRFTAPSGTYTLAVALLGYDTVEQTVVLKEGEITRVDVRLSPHSLQLEEVTVMAGGVGRVKRSAYNVVALDTKDFQNSTKNLSDVLDKLPGMKLREAGGVGSDMQVMLDGFSGKHVKVFIDGVPLEGGSESFDLNNIPANFAERIEVYKGVVPVGFGSDAIGGVINVVTNKNRRDWYLDASYSYGSFNTHKSYVNFGQTLRNGMAYEINAFQNYSDNDYHIDNWVEEFNHENNTSVQDESKILRLRRFHDTYHNEAVTGKWGFQGVSWADRFMLGFAYSHFYKEIQTGVYQRVVFGQKHRHGHSLSPSLEYQKRDFLLKGLDVNANLVYHHNLTHNVDTATYRYNWLGDRLPLRSPGEQSHLYNEQKDGNWDGTLTATYRIGTAHLLTANHVFSLYERTGRSLIETNSKLNNFDIPMRTRKNITGLSYRFMPAEQWNITAFAKHYATYNKGAIQSSSDKKVYPVSSHIHAVGYGAAGTYILWGDLQLKLSYEKALRLPTPLELFGDGDLERGQGDLKPERSDNVNLNVSYSHRWRRHSMLAEATLIYRNTDDYIMRGLSNVGGSGASYGYYENHGRVETKGFNLSLRYTYDRWLSLGGTFNRLDARDKERKRAEGSGQNSLTYKQRIPNQPYMYANFDINLYWRDLFARGNTLTIGWDSFYLHEFPLYWENLGDPSTKIKVPEQFSHNLSIGYSFKNGRYNLSFECRNLADTKLYDNYSLQKAGRAFYGKIRICLGD